MTEEKHTLIDEDEVYVFPASFAQQRLWFLDQFEPGSPFYNIPTAVKIKGRLNVDVFRACLEEIVWRHETLRTTFTMVDGQPMQVINPSMDIPFEVVDISHLPEKEREAESRRLVNNEARKPFDLTTGPLIRTLLVQLAEEEYVLMITMHHIISDGWSIGVFVKEIAVLYEAFSKGKESPLPELPIQYADYAAWQREWLSGEVLEEQLGYWKQKLGGHLPVLELPTDRPRPAVQSSRGNSLTVIFPKELIDQVHDFSIKTGVTPFMTYLAAFYVLLYRYSRQTDISVGTPIANRTEGETEGLIGFFVNTLVLRTDLSGKPSFKEFVQRVRQTALEGYEHQHLPFEMLVEAIQPERSMSHSPLFQVMFILQNAPTGAGGQAAGGDLIMQQMEVNSGTSTFDITISMVEQKIGLNTSVEYSTDLFDESTIRRMLNHLENILRNATRNPEMPISRIPLMDEQEWRKIVVDWNATAGDYDYHRCMHRLVEQNAAENPEAKAVVFDGKYLTYDQLNRRANQLARHLRKLGVKPETPVGISIEKSLDLMVAVLGVLKAGGAYVPMSPDYPQERLAYMIEDSQVPVLLTEEHLLERLPENSAKIVCVGRDWPEIARESDENLGDTSTPDNLAYMIYTSGSTGKAKGTMVSHASWVNSYFAWEKDYELKTRARNHLQMANFSFDVFAGDTIRALGSGGKMVLVPQEMLLQAEQLYRLMLDEEINIAEFVPAVLRNLTQYLDQIGKDLSFMRALIAGSDSWYVGEYQQFLKYCGPETRLINSFGLTEASIDSTYFEAARLDLPKDRLVPIGRPFSNMQIYIVDEELQPTPIGVPGEIIVAGAGLARGYHHRPDLTAEKFVSNPFSDRSGARMYRTGDMGRYLPDGNIEFLGRMDTQVKLRGFRIELGEIESNLADHPEVKQAAVIVREDRPNDKRLVAYFVPANENVPEKNELRRFLLEKLPDYMVPSAFIAMDQLPLTPNGKIDRRSLPKPDESAYSLEENYVSPRTPDEEIMAGIWAEVLHLDKVGIYDNFFELGGHSLLATQLISRVRETFEVDLPLRNIFEYPTVAGLAEQVEINRKREAGVEAPPIMAVSRQEKLPLSFAQQRLWFLFKLEPDSPFYNIPEAVRIKGHLDPKILERCLNTVIERHEILRTNFVEVEGEPELVIHPERKITIPVEDLRELNPEQREAKARHLMREVTHQPFDLSKDMLLRVKLLRMAEDEYILISTIHHIISDDWSSQVMIGEIALLYDAYSRNLPSPLPPLPVQYADFAHWQRNWLKGEVLEAQINFWKDYLAGSPPLLELPTDRPRPAVQTSNGDYIAFHLNPELSKAVKELTLKQGATLFMSLLAAFDVLLYRYSGQEDFNIGTPIANRNRAEIEPLIGFFVNTLVLRSDLSGNPT
ncbi:MAG TPA: amino acid adenylation domain-containing protein, partial [Caldithrix abyssi]|nr:amino acid adenylation domain-containing protein [Caldithrix abyssi]